MTELFGPDFAYSYLIVGAIIGFIVGRVTAPRAAARTVGGGRAHRVIGGGPAVPVSPAAAPVELEVGGRKLEVDPAAMDEIRQLAAAGRKIEAIKHLREATGLGLAEAKELVEAIERMKG